MDQQTIRIITILAVLGAVPVSIFVLGPIANAIAQRIVGRHLPPGTGEGEHDDEPDPGGTLRHRLTGTENRLADVTHQLEETQQRLMDVEERLDFTERLLAQQADRERLGPGT